MPSPGGDTGPGGVVAPGDRFGPLPPLPRQGHGLVEDRRGPGDLRRNLPGSFVDPHVPQRIWIERGHGRHGVEARVDRLRQPVIEGEHEIEIGPLRRRVLPRVMVRRTSVRVPMRMPVRVTVRMPGRPVRVPVGVPVRRAGRRLLGLLAPGGARHHRTSILRGAAEQIGRRWHDLHAPSHLHRSGDTPPHKNPCASPAKAAARPTDASEATQRSTYRAAGWWRDGGDGLPGKADHSERGQPPTEREDWRRGARGWLSLAKVTEATRADHLPRRGLRERYAMWTQYRIGLPHARSPDLGRCRVGRDEGRQDCVHMA